jgi:hypothetical protein
MTTNSVRTQIIGAAGEALVTYKLLKHEIDSARMTTDAGVDLVMYIPGHRRSATIQVKAQISAWVFDRDCPAEWLAVADLSSDKAWLFEIEQARELAQQKPESGKWRIYWYPDDSTVGGNPRRESDMAAYEVDTVLDGITARQSVEPESVAAQRES